MKKGEISDEADFVRSANEYFTVHYRPLIPCVNALRKAVFPYGRRWAKEDTGLYDRMTEILRGAQRDPLQPAKVSDLGGQDQTRKEKSNA